MLSMKDEQSGRLVGIGCLAGILSLLCLATKQTIGLGVTLAIPVAVGLCLIRLEGVQKAIRFVAGFAAGWLVAAGGFTWLDGALWHPSRISDASFCHGTSSQGVAPRRLRGAYICDSEGLLVGGIDCGGRAGVLLGTFAQFRRRRKDGHKLQIRSKGFCWYCCLGLVPIVASTMATWRCSDSRRTWRRKPPIYVSLIGSGLLIVYYLWRFLSGNLSRRQSQLALFATIAFIAAFMTSLSFPAFEAMIIPGLGLILAVLLNDFEGWRRWVVYAVCGALLFCTPVQGKNAIRL